MSSAYHPRLYSITARWSPAVPRKSLHNGRDLLTLAIKRAVAQHVIADRHDRSSNGDRCFLRAPGEF
jgi:hypothetical protein